MRKAVYLGYRSHQTSTCGLHIHVNRKSLGLDSIEQETVISRILYFVEHHWNELLKFSRRSEYAMDQVVTATNPARKQLWKRLRNAAAEDMLRSISATTVPLNFGFSGAL